MRFKRDQSLVSYSVPIRLRVLVLILLSLTLLVCVQAMKGRHSGIFPNSYVSCLNLMHLHFSILTVLSQICDAKLKPLAYCNSVSHGCGVIIHWKIWFSLTTSVCSSLNLEIQRKNDGLDNFGVAQFHILNSTGTFQKSSKAWRLDVTKYWGSNVDSCIRNNCCLSNLWHDLWGEKFQI